MKRDQIAREIKERGLYTLWNHEPVTGKKVYAVVMHYPDTFVKTKGQFD